MQCHADTFNTPKHHGRYIDHNIVNNQILRSLFKLLQIKRITTRNRRRNRTPRHRTRRRQTTTRHRSSPRSRETILRTMVRPRAIQRIDLLQRRGPGHVRGRMRVCGAGYALQVARALAVVFAA